MIETNRQKVDPGQRRHASATSTCPTWATSGLNEFVKQYFPQIRKEGMIIDVRYNGGGFVDQLIFERLRRILAGMDSARNLGIRHRSRPMFSTDTWLRHQPLCRFRRRSSSATSSSTTSWARSSASAPGAEYVAFAERFL